MARVAVITADFYDEIARGLQESASKVLHEKGIETTYIRVPGAFELPMALSRAIKTGVYDGYVVLGCVVRGETDHYRYVCESCCRGVMDVSCRADASVGFGVLTVATLAQARARLDYGARAARTCLAMMALQGLKT
ncbi:MAG: 6,7-dimethyl-8-ribityllumazine synthase [Alphaproteobacteria bacterium GM202ARS2]|nr:6,7-dimethyl-8-ribityllumazine synthase [Alphaproteobacteria bacterium GM202ARS2]